MAEDTTFEEQVEATRAADREEEILEAGGGAIVTPAGAAAIGKNKDQAKMFGTSQQKSAALSNASQNAAQVKDVSQDDLLATAVGEQTFEDKAADAATEAAKEYSTKMEGFGSLGKRVENVVKSQMSGDSEISLSGMEFDVDEEAITSAMSDDITDEGKKIVLDTVNNFDDIINGSSDSSLVGPNGQPIDLETVSEADLNSAREKFAFDSIVELNKSGYFKDKDASALQTLKVAFKNNPEGLKSATASAIANSVVDVEDLDIGFLIDTGMLDPEQDLGFSSDEMSATFGEDWATLTTDKIAAVMDNEFTQKYARADKLRKALTDPNTSPAIKQQLQAELDEMGVGGALQMEELSKKTIEDVANSGIVMFGGKPQDITDLLDDEKIKADTQKYLKDPESPESLKFIEDNPQYAAFMDKAMETMKKSGETLGEAFDEFIAVNKDNKAVLDQEFNGTKVAEELWESMGFNDDMASERIDPSTNNLYNAIKADGRISSEAIGSLQQLVKSGVIDKDYFKNISPESASGLVNLLANPDNQVAIQDLVSLDEDWARLEKDAKAPKSHDDNSQYYERFFGTANITKESQIDEKLKKLKIAAKMGYAGAQEDYDHLSQVFDKDGDGKIDDPATVRKAMSEYVKDNSSLEDLITSNLSGGVQDMRDPINVAGEEAKFIDRVMALSGNGNATSDAILANVAALDINTSISSIEELRQAGVISSGKYQQVKEGMLNRFSSETDTLVNSIKQEVKDDENIKKYKEFANDHLKTNQKYLDFWTKKGNAAGIKKYQDLVNKNTAWMNGRKQKFLESATGKQAKDAWSQIEQYKKMGPMGADMATNLRDRLTDSLGYDAMMLVSGGR